ncbi:MAG: OmpH family outer membrane protein [Limnochordaceae bacterium]|nr:OmpH family outer membrane protein [Limnochordaceae bacterium]
MDLDRVATEYLQPALGEPLRQETARLQAQFDKEAAALDAELNEKVKGASDAEKQNLRNQYQQQKQALFARYQQQLDQRKQEMINQRLPKVKDAIGRVAARLGLEAVLDKNLVIWGGRDITDQVLLELGIKTSGSTEKPSSSSR